MKTHPGTIPPVHLMDVVWMVLPETERKSSTEVMSSTASVRTRTCFSHWSLKTSMLSWATLLWGLAANVRAAFITYESKLVLVSNDKEKERERDPSQGKKITI